MVFEVLKKKMNYKAWPNLCDLHFPIPRQLNRTIIKKFSRLVEATSTRSYVSQAIFIQIKVGKPVMILLAKVILKAILQVKRWLSYII